MKSSEFFGGVAYRLWLPHKGASPSGPKYKRKKRKQYQIPGMNNVASVSLPGIYSHSSEKQPERVALLGGACCVRHGLFRCNQTLMHVEYRA